MTQLLVARLGSCYLLTNFVLQWSRPSCLLPRARQAISCSQIWVHLFGLELPLSHVWPPQLLCIPSLCRQHRPSNQEMAHLDLYRSANHCQRAGICSSIINLRGSSRRHVSATSWQVLHILLKRRHPDKLCLLCWWSVTQKRAVLEITC